MLRQLFILTSLLVQTACVTSGSITKQGFSHPQLGYSLAFQEGSSQSFLGKSWKIELDHKGQFKQDWTQNYRIKSQSLESTEPTEIRVNYFDLLFKHLETNGAISVQSFPLSEETAQKKLEILAQNFAETLAGQYFVSFAEGSSRLAYGKNLVTNVLSLTPGTKGTAETLDAIVEVANAEQIRLNPEHRLLKYRIVMIRPQPQQGWVVESMDNRRQKREQTGQGMRKDTFPAMIVLVYAMDYKYFETYESDFDQLLARLKLRS